MALSTRIRTILDPVGPRAIRHAGRTAASPPLLRVAVYVPTSGARRWVVDELDAVGAESMTARTFDHLLAAITPASALSQRIPTAREGARPRRSTRRGHGVCSVVVADYDALSANHISSLASARWAGFGGPIVLLAKKAVPARIVSLLGVDHVMSLPAAPGALHSLLVELATR